MWYVLTDKWILDKKLGIPMIQLTDHMKLKKKEDQSVDASVLPRRGHKMTMGGRGWEGLGRKRGGGGSDMGGDGEEGQRIRKLNGGV